VSALSVIHDVPATVVIIIMGAGAGAGAGTATMLATYASLGCV